MKTEIELHKAVREAQEKYIYFLLAASGAAIGFAITQTQKAVLSTSMIPLAIAVACWGVSFYCGCKQLLQSANFAAQNIQFLRMKRGALTDFPFSPELVRAIQQSLEEQSSKTGKWGQYQFRFVVAGAVFYIAWHVLEMYLRTP